jgi:hypothetical protein
MTDEDFATLHAILGRRGGFGHREHLELAWNYLARYSTDAAAQAVGSAIRHLAGVHGETAKYHETMTRGWVHLVAVHRVSSQTTSFDEFMAANRGLLDRHLLDRHYSQELIASPAARSHWTRPDLRDLPPLD